MTKTIDTLVEDIYELIDRGFIGSQDWTDTLGKSIAQQVQNKFDPEERLEPGRLRPSVMGDPCDRKLWYSVYAHEDRERLPPPTLVKFLYGNILEEMVLALAEVAGHDVKAQQKEVSLYGVTGHIDAIVDGVLIDVKSASSIAFTKFAGHLTPDKDSFGYLTQIGFYLAALQDDPDLVDKGRAAFLAIDKTLGKLVLDVHPRSELKQDFLPVVVSKTNVLASPEVPARGFMPEADGKSGNLKLGTECSYCAFKNKCWPRLRTFLYSSGPRYLTHVAREPDVPELKS